MSEWVDATSYGNYGRDRGRVAPSSWELMCGRTRISVHRYLRLPGWFVSANGPAVHIDRWLLPNAGEDLEAAKRDAIAIVRRACLDVLDALPQVEELPAVERREHEQPGDEER